MFENTNSDVQLVARSCVKCLKFSCNCKIITNKLTNEQIALNVMQIRHNYASKWGNSCGNAQALEILMLSATDTDIQIQYFNELMKAKALEEKTLMDLLHNNKENN